jgi:large exoprotein involved in heme utilization and adhesion
VILGGDGHPVQGFGGRGGTIEIEASGSVEIAGTGRIYRVDLLDRTPREVEISSSISTSTGFEDLQLGGSNTAGSIRLRAGHLRVADGGEILVNSFNSSGEAGNLRVRAGSVSLDNRARLVADSSSGSGGNISISAGEFLSLRRQSSITANAGNNGDGGNITIESPFILAVPSENSDITANAEQGTGGNVTIVTDGMFGIRFRPAVTPLSDITVSSRFAGPGNFTLTRLEIDPQSELVEVPARVVDIDRLIVRTCGPDGRLDRWEFTVTGRGGYPLPPIEPWKYRKAWWIWGGAPPGNPRPLPSRRRCRAARSSRPGHGSSARGKSV